MRPGAPFVHVTGFSPDVLDSSTWLEAREEVDLLATRALLSKFSLERFGEVAPPSVQRHSFGNAREVLRLARWKVGLMLTFLDWAPSWATTARGVARASALRCITQLSRAPSPTTARAAAALAAVVGLTPPADSEGLRLGVAGVLDAVG